jgi:hypothetical protein
MAKERTIPRKQVKEFVSAAGCLAATNKWIPRAANAATGMASMVRHGKQRTFTFGP